MSQLNVPASLIDGVVKFVDSSLVYRIEVGMALEISDTDGGAVTGSAATGYVISVDRTPGAETFTCERCARSFTLRYRLTEHSKTCGKKPIHCKCGLALGHKSSLKTHILQWNKTAPGEHADVTPVEEGGAAGGDADAGVGAGDPDADAMDAAVMAVGAGDADDGGLTM